MKVLGALSIVLSTISSTSNLIDPALSSHALSKAKEDKSINSKKYESRFIIFLGLKNKHVKNTCENEVTI